MNCPKCNKEMKHRDYISRMVKMPGGKKRKTKIERVYCKECRLYRRILPAYILPFKHYPKKLIQGVKQGIYEELYLFDYPCDMTIKRWKS